MRKVMLFLLFVLSSTTWAQRPQPPFENITYTEEQKPFAELSQKIWNLMADKDADALSGIFHPNCEFVHMGGYWGTEQELQIIRGGFIWYKHTEVYGAEVKIINENNVAVYSTVVLDAELGGNVTSHPFFVTQMFIRENDEWKLASFVFTTRTVGPGITVPAVNAQIGTPEKESVVYMTREISSEALLKIYDALGVRLHGNVAVKISTGEPGGHNFLQPSLIKDLVNSVDGTIVECNTAYEGKRYSTKDHWAAIRNHGFLDIAKVDIMDEEGEFRIPVVDSSNIRFDIVGSHLKNYQSMINLAHFKGHAMGGFGGVLKNQSIGMASANGKANIHTAGKVQTKEELWAGIAKTEQDCFLESMAAAAQAVHNYFGEGNIVYINVMNNLSVDCDCDSHPHDPEMKDIGILASTDPVALDQACVDLVFNYPSKHDDNAEALIERINSRHGIHTIEHAEKIGLGSRLYRIISIDK